MQQEQLLANNQKFKLTEEDQRLAQDTDFMSNIIQQRKQDIDLIGDIMNDINSIAKDVAVEVQGQGTKLVKLSDQIDEAKVNVVLGLDQLEQAQKY
mmetsp:Transcript_4173/g.7075  ORF Transcript_4173/g.7075 Transcript_4173/m.7075 type:complete len:96 (+) Transcript_4173:528-815(+)